MLVSDDHIIFIVERHSSVEKMADHMARWAEMLRCWTPTRAYDRDDDSTTTDDHCSHSLRRTVVYRSQYLLWLSCRVIWRFEPSSEPAWMAQTWIFNVITFGGWIYLYTMSFCFFSLLDSLARENIARIWIFKRLVSLPDDFAFVFVGRCSAGCCCRLLIPRWKKNRKGEEIV